MTKRFFAGLVGLTSLAVVLTGSYVSAQRGPGPGGPGGPGMMPPPHAMMKVSADGVFVLAGPTLVKYNASTLKQEGTLQLLEKRNEPGVQGEGPQMPPPPPGPAQMLIAPDALVLIVAGDQFFRLDAATMQVKAKGALPRPTGPGDGNMPPMPGPGMPPPPGQGPGMEGGPGMPPFPRGPMGPPPALPTMELLGKTLYVQRGPQIVAINVNDGKVIAQAELPKPPAR